MSPMDVVEWAGALGVAFVVLLIITVGTRSLIREFKNNPLKKSFDTPEDKK